MAGVCRKGADPLLLPHCRPPVSGGWRHGRRQGTCHCIRPVLPPPPSRRVAVTAFHPSPLRRWRSSLSSPPPSPSSPLPLPSYSSVVSSLHSINRGRAMVLGLETMRSLLSSLPPSFYSPSAFPPSVHVTGSNGKGSVAWKVAKALRAQGLKVGVFSSPHLSTFRERVVVDEEMIGEEEVCQYLPLLLSTAAQCRPPLSPTFFELCTALAFVHFQRSAVDVAVVEVGLGGRLDSTNVISPRLSILTSIGLEHTQVLGDTLEAICREKCGIIKPHTPVLVGPTVPLEVVRPIAAQFQAEVISVPPLTPSSQQRGASLPSFDEENRAIASMALAVLQKDVLLHRLLTKPSDSEAVQRALDTRPPCRYDLLRVPRRVAVAPSSGSSLAPPPVPRPSSVVSVLLDVAHNPSAFHRLVAQLRADFPPPHRIRAVFGMSADKDIEGCLAPLLSHCHRIHLVKPSNSPRAASIPRLRQAVAQVLASHQLAGGKGGMAEVEEVEEEGEVQPTVALALRRCEEEADGSADSPQPHPPLLLICGSFSLFRDARKGLGLHFPTDPLDLNESSLASPTSLLPPPPPPPPLDSPPAVTPSLSPSTACPPRSSSTVEAAVTSFTASPSLPSFPLPSSSASTPTPSSCSSSHRSQVLRLYREMLHLASQVRSTPLTVQPFQDVQRAFRERKALSPMEVEKVKAAVAEAEAKVAMLRASVPFTRHRKREQSGGGASSSSAPSLPSPPSPPPSSSTSAWFAGYSRVFGGPPRRTEEEEEVVGELERGKTASRSEGQGEERSEEGPGSVMAEGDGIRRFVFDPFGEVVVPLTEEERAKQISERGLGQRRVSDHQGITDEQRRRNQRLMDRFHFKGPHWKGKR